MGGPNYRALAVPRKGGYGSLLTMVHPAFNTFIHTASGLYNPRGVGGLAIGLAATQLLLRCSHQSRHRHLRSLTACQFKKCAA